MKTRRYIATCIMRFGGESDIPIHAFTAYNAKRTLQVDSRIKIVRRVRLQKSHPLKSTAE